MPLVICPNCDETVSVDSLSGSYCCPECEENFSAEDAEVYDSPSATAEEATPATKSGWLGPLLFLIIIFLLWKWLFASRWTLMVCDEVMSNGTECSNFAHIQKDAFSNKETCLEAGRSMLTPSGFQSFECGKNCKHDGIFMLCKEICDKNGNCH